MLTVEEYLKLKNKYPDPKDNSKYHKHYDGEQEDFDKIVEYNKELIDKYHWLMPRNRWSGETDEDYDYSYTELDALPDGWYLNFGMDICKEIQDEFDRLQKEDPEGGYEESAITTKYDSDKILPYADGYRIMEIKEKYGCLSWFSNGAPRTIHDIVHKYERLSEEICIKCGKPAKWESRGWISFFCDDCAKEMFEKDEEYARNHYSNYTPSKFEDYYIDLTKDEEDEEE